MKTDKRKADQREASRRNREQKKAAGLVDYRRKIFPKWKRLLDEFLTKLRKEEDDQLENYRFAYKSALEPEVQDKIFEQFNNLGEQNK